MFLQSIWCTAGVINLWLLLNKRVQGLHCMIIWMHLSKQTSHSQCLYVINNQIVQYIDAGSDN